MIVEVGGEDDKIQNTYELLVATIKAVKKVPNNRGLGVLYWEPQGAKSWSGYSLSAWLENGKPSPALDAFKEN
jgi:arabinogalactan endo-1,4-beta-galactosidase